MIWRDVINLLSFTDGSNAMGDPIKISVVSADIFANKQSIKRSEFYQAAAVGLRPELTFVIHEDEYNDEPMLKYNNKTYNIIRTYVKGTDLIELICQGVTNNAGS